LIAASLYLQHAFDLSDEAVVWQWLDNPYWQVLTGETYLQTRPAIDPSSLTRWRKRLGEATVEELFVGAGRNVQMILRKLRLFYALILAVLLNGRTVTP
jgi:hypothetical protein